MKEKELTAYCGIFCGDCIRYKSRISDLADEMLLEMEKQHFSEYAKVKQVHTSEFENFDEFISTLKAISKIKCELPCRLGGNGSCMDGCPIVICVKSKTFTGCWECNDFDNCDKLEILKPFHGEGLINNLWKIKKYGLEFWAKHRDKCYPWL